MIDINFIFFPLHFDFMLKALVTVCLIAVPTALLSCFLVLKGWALLGDAISHAVLPGVLIAYMLGFPLVIGATVAGVVCAALTGFLAENCRVKPDTIMGIVFSGLFGLGLVLYSFVQSNIHLDHILFGNILGMNDKGVISSFFLSSVVSLIFLSKWRDFFLYAFDPIQARASGLSTSFLYYGILILISFTVVVTLSATGIILAIGLLIAPGAISFLIVRRLSSMLVVAVLINVSAMIFGTYLSFFLDSSPAPTIILILVIIFLFVFIRKTAFPKKSN